MALQTEPKPDAVDPKSARAKPSTPAPRAKKRAGRFTGQGQWALAQLEPLNPNERMKKDDDALNVRARIENIYAHTGFAGIDPQDLRGRFRWWGLYTQRKPGIDGGRTATLEPEELEDEYFMMRVRVDGGQLDVEQLRTIAEISRTFARDSADITDRQNIQLHWVQVEDVPEIWRRLESVGLSTQESCGDCPRVVIGSPVAGISADEIVDGTPAIREIADRYLGDPEFSNLPRKYKTAISGAPVQDVAHEINDIAFIGVEHPDHGPGFDLWVGGGLATNPQLALRLGAWVPVEEVPEVWAGVTRVFRDYGYRRLRNRARLKYLIADWGVEQFRYVLEGEYLKRKLVDGPAPPTTEADDHIGVRRQRDGRYYIGFAPTVGKMSGTLLGQIADAVEEHGSARLATTPFQKFVVLDVEEDRVESLVETLGALGLRARPSTFRRNTMACTGITYCKLAITETKDTAAWLIDELERRLPEVDEPITVNVNGCPNSCARVQVADIGLKGQIIAGRDGAQVPGYQVHLGGRLGQESGFGRKVRALKVASDDLPDYVERVVRRYLAGRADGERFATWALRVSDEELQ
ncbi:MAG: nitrite/sulfite reductase [Streptosporangiales bacterium]|nr:nitrite/sulfite reductase [Streptosporangiales bacterium]